MHLSARKFYRLRQQRGLTSNFPSFLRLDEISRPPYHYMGQHSSVWLLILQVCLIRSERGHRLILLILQVCLIRSERGHRLILLILQVCLIRSERGHRLILRVRLWQLVSPKPCFYVALRPRRRDDLLGTGTEWEGDRVIGSTAETARKRPERP